MKMDNNKKKIGLLAIVLIILAGMVIVGLKGFNVSLMYRSHETINFVAGKEMVVSDVEDLAKEILKDKKFDVRGIEEFEDAVSISTENFTVEEKENLVNKINEKYGLENKVEDVKIQTVSNVRLRGRERDYTAKGMDVMNQFAEIVSDVAEVEKKPNFEGRSLIMVLAPKTDKK